ncbi:GyrI-like domain-containing protein [Flagellimonas flava]|uniref:GyrI-like domain-containing protein n=1 Tax=Flagellimonas flava TaxID=570519 RepID=UPI003D64932F
MEPQINVLKEKQLVGMHTSMSLVHNKTFELWGKFRSRIHEIENRLSSDFISMQVYDPSYFANFSPTNNFVKWASVEVADHENIPDGMDSFTLKSGLYAVFHYKGSSADTSIFQYIFTVWLPNSKYLLDDRPHFEVLGSKYRNNDPNSEEEIWIPIKEK